MALKLSVKTVWKYQFLYLAVSDPSTGPPVPDRGSRTRTHGQDTKGSYMKPCSQSRKTAAFNAYVTAVTLRFEMYLAYMPTT